MRDWLHTLLFRFRISGALTPPPPSPLLPASPHARTRFSSCASSHVKSGYASHFHSGARLGLNVDMESGRVWAVDLEAGKNLGDLWVIKPAVLAEGVHPVGESLCHGLPYCVVAG